MLLYHYTNLAGFLGILRSSSIWGTHPSFLNDESEFVHALNFAKDVSGSVFMEDDYLAAFGWAVRHALETVRVDNLYVTSFSEKPDLLSQWRGYCSSGGGLCLGFSAESIREFCVGKGYRLEKCIYSQPNHIAEIRALVDKALAMYPSPLMSREEYDELSSKQQVDAEIDYRLRTTEGPDTLQAQAATDWLCSEIAELAPLLKHHGFHEEAEWRIVAKDPAEEVKFRPTSSYLIPYVEFPILGRPATPALTEVIIGPSPNQQRCEDSVTMFLSSIGAQGVKVVCSKIPYNSW